MFLDPLPTGKTQARATRGLDLLPTSHLARCLNIFIAEGKVEGKSPRTISTYESQIGAFSQFLKDYEVITSTEIRLFLLAVKEKGVSPDTVYTYHKNLRAFFNWLVTEEILNTSPMANIKPPRLPRRMIKPLSDEDIGNILLMCQENNLLELRNRAIILTFLDTGLRLAEMAGIQKKDIIRDSEVIRVLGKGGKERIVRIGKNTQKAILRYEIVRGVDSLPQLWLTEERQPFKRDGIQSMVDRILRVANVSSDKRGPHILRHTAAINCLRNGMSVFELQIMLGHSSLEMTRRYVSTLGAEDVIRAHRTASPVDRLRL